MERSSFATMECPIARAVDQVGDAWSLLILREAYKGASTFSDFEERLPIAPTTLTRKIDALTEHGFFQRKVYQTRPRRDRYALTDKALDFMPILIALGVWGNRWLAPNGALLDVVDAKTGSALEVTVVDKKTALPIRAGTVALAAGPGASKRLRASLPKPLVLGPNGVPARNSEPA